MMYDPPICFSHYIHIKEVGTYGVLVLNGGTVIDAMGHPRYIVDEHGRWFHFITHKQLVPHPDDWYRVSRVYPRNRVRGDELRTLPVGVNVSLRVMEDGTFEATLALGGLEVTVSGNGAIGVLKHGAKLLRSEYEEWLNEATKKGYVQEGAPAQTVAQSEDGRATDQRADGE